MKQDRSVLLGGLTRLRRASKVGALREPVLGGANLLIEHHKKQTPPVG